VNTRPNGTPTYSPSVFTISLVCPTGVRIEFADSYSTCKHFGSDRQRAFDDAKQHESRGPAGRLQAEQEAATESSRGRGKI
jgi:hypothetical protein